MERRPALSILRGVWMVLRRDLAVVSAVVIITAVGACSSDREARPSRPSDELKATEVLDGSCAVVSDSAVTAALGDGLERRQVGPVSCAWTKPGEETPTLMVSIAPSGVSVGNDPTGTTAVPPPVIDGVTTQWRESALPSGTRLGASPTGWSVTVDVAPQSATTGRTAVAVMTDVLERLPESR